MLASPDTFLFDLLSQYYWPMSLFPAASNTDYTAPNKNVNSFSVLQ